MQKIAFIIKNYGDEYMFGGAEAHCRVLAQRLVGLYSVDVFCQDDRLLETELEIKDDKGVRVYHFKNLVCNDGLQISMKSYLTECQIDYRAIIVFKRDSEILDIIDDFSNILFVPLAHDVPELLNGSTARFFENSRGILFNTPEEKELVSRKFGIDKPSVTTIYGLEDFSYSTHAENNPLQEKYILYIGRVDNNKNFAELNEFFILYKKKCPSDLKLVVLGKIAEGMNIIASDSIKYLGFVSDEEKERYIKNAMFLVLPSREESLSIVILEAMQKGMPVLVNGTCPVLKSQCKRSNAGFYYENFSEFTAAMNLLYNDSNLRKIMGDNGRKYVETNYSWNEIISNIHTMIENYDNESYEFSDISEPKTIRSSVHIEEIYKESIINKHEKNFFTFFEEQRKNFLMALSTKEKIVIVGAGDYGLCAFRILGKLQNKVVCFTDQNYETLQIKAGKPVVSLEKAIDSFPDAGFLVTPKYANYFLGMGLVKKGIHQEQIFYYHHQYINVNDEQ